MKIAIKCISYDEFDLGTARTTRSKIFNVLRYNPMCAGDLALLLGLSRPRILQCLKELMLNRKVVYKRFGSTKFYGVKKRHRF